VGRIADEIAGSGSLRLGGLMAVAPLGEPPLPAFERLAAVAARLRRDHPTATVVSAGMSGDLEEAIRCGATHVRVGSAVLGERPTVQ
jgi:PLP dependent protein